MSVQKQDENKLLDYLLDFFQEHGYPPTIREMSQGTGFSISKVNHLLDKLELRGLLIRHSKTVRGITLLTHRLNEKNYVRVPLAGRVVASAPLPVPAHASSNDDDDYILVPRRLLTNRADEGLFVVEFLETQRKKFKISVAHPRTISKGVASLFLVQIHIFSDIQVSKNISKEFGIQKVSEHVWDIELNKGSTVRIKFSSPVLSFSDPVIKSLKGNLVIARFTVIPQEICRPGIHYVVLSLTDMQTHLEYESISFSVRVVDFVFDHISRPFLSKLMSAILGLSSLIIFILTALEQVDKTFGLTAGTAATLLSSAILVRFWLLFQQPRVSHTP